MIHRLTFLMARHHCPPYIMKRVYSYKANKKLLN